MTSKLQQIIDLDRDVLFISKKEKTFANDELLPDLPVPSLHQTLQKYLDSVIVHVSEDEYKQTEEIVSEFEKGTGALLQEKLLEHAKHHRNWLEKWWEDIAYLSQRSPMIPLMNMAGYCPEEAMMKHTQIQGASFIIHYYLQFWKLIRTEQLRPHYSKNVPWSMHQFRRLFNTCRIPAERKDILVNFFKTESEGEQGPTHIIVMCRGHIFTFDGVDQDGEPLTMPEYEKHLQYINDLCEVAGEGPGIGSLTAADRETWAKNREWLCHIHPSNKEKLDIISSALFVVVLDENTAESASEVLIEGLAGDCRNRWADKSLTAIALKNGKIASNSDHTPFDGMVPLMLGYYTGLSARDTSGIWTGTGKIREFPNPEELEFIIDDRIMAAIESARLGFQELAKDIICHSQSYTQYGKDFLRPHKFHPEAYVQMALQLAFYRLHGHPAPTYVTASTRQFYHGRTETCRSCFPEAIDWVKCTLDDVATPSNQYKLLKRAIDKFVQLMSECTGNSGCDRHLLGLYCIAMENGETIPEIFLDPSWEKTGGSGNFVLSTSCVGYTSLTGCVLPMCEDGYGCFYSVENNRMNFVVTAFKRSTKTSANRFFESLCHALSDMQYIITTANL